MTEKKPRGRPRHHAEKMTKRGVSMPPEYWTKAEALGSGEASAGIRKALEGAKINEEYFTRWYQRMEEQGALKSLSPRELAKHAFSAGMGWQVHIAEKK